MLADGSIYLLWPSAARNFRTMRMPRIVECVVFSTTAGSTYPIGSSKARCNPQ